MNVFEYSDYRDIIEDALQQKYGRGSKIQLAEYLSCNAGYISQVLKKGKVHFSPENLMKISTFLGFSSSEEEYIMGLLHFERSGSVELKKFWEKKNRAQQKLNANVEKQIKNISHKLSDTAKAIYYSHWAYSAIHMFVSIQHFKSIDEIANRIGVLKSHAYKVMQFLESHHLVVKGSKFYEIGQTRIHLKPDSPLIKSHHQNFRNKAIVSPEADNDFDLHYSAVLTLSKKDSLKIRSMLLKFIAEKEEVLIPSANEDIVGLNLDLFKF